MQSLVLVVGEVVARSLVLPEVEEEGEQTPLLAVGVVVEQSRLLVAGVVVEQILDLDEEEGQSRRQEAVVERSRRQEEEGVGILPSCLFHTTTKFMACCNFF